MTERIEVGLPPEIVNLIRRQIAAFRHRQVDFTDDGFWRLRLAASPDEQVAHDFDELAASTIANQRSHDLDTFETGLDAEKIDLDTAHAWIRALNQLRLVLGTDLEVTDDDRWRRQPGEEGFAEAVMYDLLTQLQGSLIVAVSEAEGF